MEKILSQHFTYAIITPFRNYSKLKDRRSTRTTFNDVDIDDIDSEGESNSMTFSFDDDLFGTKRKKKVGRVLGFSTPLTKRKTRFFYNNEEPGENIVINYGSLKSWELNSFETTKDRQIKRHFGDPFSEITIHTAERSININGDKLTIKVYHQTKHRKLNGKYFRKGSNIQSLTFNLKTGNFVIAEISKTSKATQNRFRKNCFYTLYSLLSSRNSMFNIGKNHLVSKSKLLNEFKSIFDDKIYVDEVNKQFNFNHDFSLFSTEKFFRSVCQKFIETKKIKVCDSYESLLVAYYPTEKYLKKNERKLVASILDLFKIKSKVTVKLMHQYPDIDLSVLVKVCLMLGKDYSKYLGNISGEVIEKTEYSLKSFEVAQKKNMLRNYITDFKINYNIRDIEKENIVKVLSDSKINEATINSIYDHFKMIDKILPYDPNVFFSARNYKDFHNEHMRFSKIISAIRKGWVVEYDFDKKLIDLIEEPIPVKGEETKDNEMNNHIWLYPHILKREEEYDEEGKFMHHCVGSYSDREMSVIISLRTEDGLDRVTSEFHAETGLCIQSRHFCNGVPPEHFNSAIEMLKDKVSYSAKKKMLKSSNKRKVPVKINGVEIKKEIDNDSSRTLLQLLEAGEL